MPLISVIVPVYKVEPYLRRCVDSILAQTFTDFELILVDDGSPDNCGAICDEYAEKDVRVHVIHQENGGLSAARNAGIDWAFAHSDSEWLSFVDSDDWVHPQMLELLYGAVCSQNVRISICKYQVVKAEERWITIDNPQVKCWPVENFFIKHNASATIACCKLYHKECFESIRYPVARIHEDEFVTYRILFGYEQIAFVDSVLYAYFYNPAGITKSPWTIKRLDGIDAFEEQIAFFSERGLFEARTARIDKYLRLLCGYKKRISEEASEKEKGYALWVINKKLWWNLLKYRKMFPFEKRWWFIYESAFPNIMNIYWRLCSAKNKMMKVFGKW